MAILSNQARCMKCGDAPFSAHRHDFKPCKCGAISVDGGMSYLRRVGDLSLAEEMSISVPDEALEAAKEAVRWAIETGRNELGLVSAIARAFRDNGVDLVTRADDHG